MDLLTRDCILQYLQPWPSLKSTILRPVNLNQRASFQFFLLIVIAVPGSYIQEEVRMQATYLDRSHCFQFRSFGRSIRVRDPGHILNSPNLRGCAAARAIRPRNNRQTNR